MSVSSILLDPNNPSAEPEVWSDLNVKSVIAQDITTDNITVLGGINATQLQGVNISSAAPADTQVLTYSAGSGEWVPAAGGGGGSLPYDPINVDLYINQSGGNDANDGLSSGQAVQTWGRLLVIGSGYNVQQITIHLVAGQTYTNLGVANTDDYIDMITTEFTRICDFRPLGASIVKVITDTAGLDTNTPSATGSWTPQPSTINYAYIDHAAITTGGFRMVYIPSTDTYYSSDGNQNSGTRTYLVNLTAPALVPVEYFDSTDLATFNFSINTIISASQKLIFERVNLSGEFKCYGNVLVRGCDVTNSSWYNKGNDLIIRDSYFNGINILSGRALLYQCFSDDALAIQQSNVEVSYCVVDSSACERNSSVLYDSFVVQGGTDIDDSRARIQGGGYNNSIRITRNGSAYVDTVVLGNGCNISLEDCSSCDTVNPGGTTFSLQCIDNSIFNGLNCAIGAVGNQRSIYLTNGSSASFNGSMNDSSATGTLPMIDIINNSSLLMLSSVSTTTGRTGRLINVSNNSELTFQSNLWVTSALTFNDLVLIDKGSKVTGNGQVQMNTSANMIHVQKGSIWRSTAAAVQAGAGTVLQRGTTAAGAFAFDTVYNAGGPTVATNEMTLIIQI